MSEIAGFKYETWEKSSNIAHRDFQHTTMAEDFEKAPRRKWGKNHNKPSPNNKKGCEANTGNFSLLWNEYHWESNAALNFQTDAERLFGFEDKTNEDGSYTFVGIFPYSFGDSNREALGDEEWEEIFGFVPDPVDEEE